MFKFALLQKLFKVHNNRCFNQDPCFKDDYLRTGKDLILDISEAMYTGDHCKQSMLNGNKLFNEYSFLGLLFKYLWNSNIDIDTAYNLLKVNSISIETKKKLIEKHFDAFRDFIYCICYIYPKNKVQEEIYTLYNIFYEQFFVYEYKYNKYFTIVSDCILESSHHRAPTPTFDVDIMIARYMSVLFKNTKSTKDLRHSFAAKDYNTNYVMESVSGDPAINKDIVERQKEIISHVLEEDKLKAVTVMFKPIRLLKSKVIYFAKTSEVFATEKNDTIGIWRVKKGGILETKNVKLGKVKIYTSIDEYVKEECSNFKSTETSFRTSVSDELEKLMAEYYKFIATE